MKITIWLFTLCSLFLSLNSNASANVYDLMRQEKVLVNVYPDRQEAYAIGEKINLNIEVLTDTWFLKGAKVQHLDTIDAIVMQQHSTTINSITRRNGRKYASQIVEIPIFSTKHGKLEIPSLSVDFKVKGESEDVIAKVITRPFSIDIMLPSPHISVANKWVVGHNVQLEERIEVMSSTQSQDESMVFVGDSIKRSISLVGQDTTSMLMPKLINATDYESDSVRVYPELDRRSDKFVRGTGQSELKQSLSILVQDAGIIHLPEVSVLWWDPKTQTEQWLYLPAHQFSVKHTFSSFVRVYWYWLGLAVLIAIVAVYLLAKAYTHVRELIKTDRMPLQYQFGVALFKADFGRCESVLYRKLKKKHGIDSVYEASNPVWSKVNKDYYQCWDAPGKKWQKQRRLLRFWMSL